MSNFSGRPPIGEDKETAYKKDFLRILKEVREGSYPYAERTEDPLLKAKVYAMTTLAIEKIATHTANDKFEFVLDKEDLFTNVSRLIRDYESFLMNKTADLSWMRDKDSIFYASFERLLGSYARSKGVIELSAPSIFINGGIATAVESVCNAFLLAVVMYSQDKNIQPPENEIPKIVADIKFLLSKVTKLDIETFLRSFRGVLDGADRSIVNNNLQMRLVRTPVKSIEIRNLILSSNFATEKRIGCPINFGSIKDESKNVRLFDALLGQLFSTLVDLYFILRQKEIV